MRKIAEKKWLQFIIGLLVIIMLPSVLAWGIDFKDWLNNRYSFIVISVIYLLSYFSIQKFATYVGSLNFRLVVPITLLYILIGQTVLFLLLENSSPFYTVISSTLMVLFFITIRYINSRYLKNIVGYIPSERLQNLPEIKNVVWHKLPNVQEAHDCIPKLNMVMADLRSDLSEEWQSFLSVCSLRQLPVYHSSRLLEMFLGRVKIDHLYENGVGSLLPSRTYQAVKRFFDISIVLISLPLILPIMIITAFLIVVESRGGIFFLQERIGQGSIPFVVYKFRSMCADSEKHGAQFAQSGDMRVTKVGRFIRKTRIDELPQFFNVLKGDMSLIGPRPEQNKFVEEFKHTIPFYEYRHIVKPGISGWAQVVQGYVADENDTRLKLQYDFFYIKNYSFALDLLITLKTFQTILTGFGAR